MLTADPGEQYNVKMHQVQNNEVLQRCMQDLALGSRPQVNVHTMHQLVPYVRRRCCSGIDNGEYM